VELGAEFMRERDIPDCCRRSYHAENSSYHETTEGCTEFTCLSCGADWTVENKVWQEEGDAL
jgi:hypothetical protein